MAYLLDIVNKIIPVLMAGLFFGAGLPALYALGLRFVAGRTEYTADGQLVEIEPPSTVVIIAILWVAKDFIHHTFGWNIFGVTGGGH